MGWPEHWPQVSSLYYSTIFEPSRLPTCQGTSDIFLPGPQLLGTEPLDAYLCGAFACSPFEVKVGTECGNQKVRAWGPGLEGGVVGKSADFVVEAIGDDVGTLGKLEASE